MSTAITIALVGFAMSLHLIALNLTLCRIAKALERVADTELRRAPASPKGVSHG